MKCKSLHNRFNAAWILISPSAGVIDAVECARIISKSNHNNSHHFDSFASYLFISSKRIDITNINCFIAILRLTNGKLLFLLLFSRASCSHRRRCVPVHFMVNRSEKNTFNNKNIGQTIASVHIASRTVRLHTNIHL